MKTSTIDRQVLVTLCATAVIALCFGIVGWYIGLHAPFQPSYDEWHEKLIEGEVSILQIPREHLNIQMYEAWVEGDPVYRLSDVPSEMVTSRMWRDWATTLSQSGDDDVLDVQMAIGNLVDRFSMNTWMRFDPRDAARLIQHRPAVFFFLPDRVVKNALFFIVDSPAGLDSDSVYAEAYAGYLKKYPYWTVVASWSLSADLLHAIPIDAWRDAVEYSGGYMHLPCALKARLAEEGYKTFDDVEFWCPDMPSWW